MRPIEKGAAYLLLLSAIIFSFPPGISGQHILTLDDAMAMAHNAHDFKIKVRQMGIDPQAAAESGVY